MSFWSHRGAKFTLIWQALVDGALAASGLEGTREDRSAAEVIRGEAPYNNPVIALISFDHFG